MERKRGGEITPIKKLFDVYRKKLQAPQKAVITTFIEIVYDHIGVRVEPHTVSYTPSTRTVSLRMSGTVKTEILLQKEDILAMLKVRLGERSAPYHII